MEPKPRSRFSRIVLALFVLFIVAYVYVYLYTPFPPPWSDIYLLVAFVLPVWLAAIFATHVWLTFRRSDAPRPVWHYFSYGLWCWAFAELGWMVYWLVQKGIPNPSILDFFWLLGFLFFGLAFMYQFRLVDPGSIWNQLSWMIGITLATVAVALLTTALVIRSGYSHEPHFIGAFLDIFYVYADLGITLAALRLARLFGRGLWGRTWIALLVMTLSDALYSFLVLSGIYAFSVESGNPLSLLTDLLYALAYLIMAIVCYAQYLLVRHGPSLTPHPRSGESAPPAGSS